MAAKRLFLIALDVLDPTLDLAAFQQLIKSDESFDGWWNHLPGVFLVSSDRTANAITDRIRTVTAQAQFLVIEVNPGESEGWLPKRSWDWIRRRTPSLSTSHNETV